MTTPTTFVLLVRLAAAAVGSDDVTDVAPGHLPLGVEPSTVAWTSLNSSGTPAIYYDPDWLVVAKPGEALYVACHEACHTAFDRRVLALPEIDAKDRAKMEMRARECGIRWASLLKTAAKKLR